MDSHLYRDRQEKPKNCSVSLAFNDGSGAGCSGFVTHETAMKIKELLKQ